MVYYDLDVRESASQIPQLLHVLPLDTHAGDQIVFLQQRETSMEIGLNQVVTVRKISDSTHVRILAVTHQQIFDGRVPHICMGNDSMWEARAVCSLLEPLALLHGVLGTNGRLNVHRFSDASVVRQGNEVLGDEVSLAELSHLRP